VESVSQFVHALHLLFSCHLVPFSLCDSKDLHFFFSAKRRPLERVISIRTRQDDFTTILVHAFAHSSVTRGCNFVHHRLPIRSQQVLNRPILASLSQLSYIIVTIAIGLRIV